MRSALNEASNAIRSSAESFIDALRFAAEELGRRDSSHVLMTAISHCRQVDAAIFSIVGALDGRADDEQLRRQRHLDFVEMPGGGYVLAGYLDPAGGATVKRALDAVIQREDAEREASRQEQTSVSPSSAGPPSQVASAPLAGVQRTAEDPKIGRNGSCPCGSARKYKHCCGG